VIDSNNFAGGANNVVKNSSQISRSAPNIENFGSRLETRKEVFCSIGMLGEGGSVDDVWYMVTQEYVY